MNREITATRGLRTDRDWRSDAACRGVDPDLVDRTNPVRLGVSELLRVGRSVVLAAWLRTWIVLWSGWSCRGGAAW